LGIEQFERGQVRNRRELLESLSEVHGRNLHHGAPDTATQRRGLLCLMPVSKGLRGLNG
jgi:hypothetical protein